MSTEKWLIDGQKVFFEHHRNLDDEDEILPKGGQTVAFLKNPDGTVKAMYSAFCRETEIYNKNIGRAVSFGRLKQLMEGRVKK